jgi:hypothetical protein
MLTWGDVRWSLAQMKWGVVYGTISSGSLSWLQAVILK